MSPKNNNLPAQMEDPIPTDKKSVKALVPPADPSTPEANGPFGYWTGAAVIAPTNFVNKSLSDWSFNVAIGCRHGCRFCYVPETSVIKQGPRLLEYGIKDPDAEWGEYVFLRPWNEKQFLASLRAAESKKAEDLSVDGNRAVIYCSTTDAYQTFSGSSAKRNKQMNQDREKLVRNSLQAILEKSTLNVRILTRSPLARKDFDLYTQFGNRLLFGMSLPTLNNKLGRIYEPHAPSPSQRLKTLIAAKAAGLNVFVALAPTYPECDESDLRATLRAIKGLGALTIYHEPINMRAENVARIESHAQSLGKTLKTEVFATKESWSLYALEQLMQVQRIAEEEGLADHLHLWPDHDLLSEAGFHRMMESRLPAPSADRGYTFDEGARMRLENQKKFLAVKQWIKAWHQRVSEWPGRTAPPWQCPQLPHPSVLDPRQPFTLVTAAHEGTR